MMELDELAHALNWAGVYQGRDCPVIRFTLADVQKIQGLRANDQCFYLAYPEYQDSPISFQVIEGDTRMAQYWVMGDRLHRNDWPALIVRDNKAFTTQMTHYQNGLRHAATGPASIVLRNSRYQSTIPTTGEDVGEDYLVETWDELEAYWFTLGDPSKYPAPHSMLCQNGFRIYRTTSETPVLSDFRDVPGFHAERMFANWNREGASNNTDPFRLRWIIASKYSREYDDGLAGRHRCEQIDEMEWIINGDIIKSTEKTRERIRTNLFSEFNVWEGPLFPNEQEMMFAFSEVSRD